MDYAALNVKATAVIKSLGIPVSLVRDGVKVGSAYGVITPNKEKKENGVTSPSIIEGASKTMLVATTSKFDPHVADFITTKDEAWQIIDVEIVKPASTVICWKLEVK